MERKRGGRGIQEFNIWLPCEEPGRYWNQRADGTIVEVTEEELVRRGSIDIGGHSGPPYLILDR